MHIRSFPLLIALAAVAALVLAPAALAGGALGTDAGLMDWTTTQFTASDGAAYDSYGQSVAIDGDTAVVGSPARTVGANEAQGAVYVYTRSNGQWDLETTLTADDGAAGDGFGYAVALDDDTIVAGAPLAGEVGAAYVFTRAGEGWADVAKLTADVSDARACDVVGECSIGYGASVSVNEMVVAVGAPFMDGDGAVYIYDWDSDRASYGLWAKLTSDEETGDHRFGYAVSFDASSRDFDLAVGAPDLDEHNGAVYLFDTHSDVWSLSQKLTQPAAVASEPAVGFDPQDTFGFSVSLRGDVLAVGSPVTHLAASTPEGAVGLGASPGAVYMFHLNEGAWSAVGKLAPESPQANDGFGVSVAVAGDLSVFVGSPFRDVDDNVRQGMVYAYDWTGQIYQDPYQLVESSGGSNDQLGTALAVSEGQVLAGAPGMTVGENMAQGSAWLFTLPAPTAKVHGHRSAWRRHAQRLSFSGVAVEGGAAVDYTQYRVRNGSWKTGASLTIKRQGVTRVQYRAVDIFGTVGATRTCKVRVDTRRPRVVAVKATAKAGTILRLRFKVGDRRPSSGSATVRVVVQNAAGQNVTKSATRPVKTNAWRTVRVNALRLSPGTYWVFLRAVDRAGNRQNGPTPTKLILR